MTRRLTPVGALALPLLLGALGVAGCGRVGGLEVPGSTAATNPSSASDAPAVVRRGADPLPAGLTTSGAVRSSDSADTDENAPKTKRSIQDPNQRLTPLSVSPVDGAPNPFGSPVSTKPPG